MGGSYPSKSRVWDPKLTVFEVASFVILYLLLWSKAFAARWDIIPSVTVKQLYSDNINLEPRGEEEDCFLTQANPGLSIQPREQQGRLDFDLDFNLQSPVSLGCSQSDNNVQVQYRSSMLAEVIKESFFVESTSTFSQQNRTNTGRIARDSLANTGNLTNVTTFSVSPFWRPHLGGYVEGEVRLRYGLVGLGDADASNSTTHGETIDLQSGSRFNLVTWRLRFDNREENRDSDGDTVRFRESDAELRFRLTRRLNLFAQAGNFDNDFTSVTNSNQNGGFYTVGAAWQPSRVVGIEGGIGRNSFVRLNLEPTRRTRFEGIVRKNEVGTNSGGTTFEGTFRHRARRTAWVARYFEETTTTQRLLLEPAVLFAGSNFSGITRDPTLVSQVPPGQLSAGSISGVPVGLVGIELPTLTDELFTRKRSQISLTGNSPKNTIGLTAYTEKREFEESRNEEEIFGLTGDWRWQIRRNVASNLRVNWQTTKDNGVEGRKDNRLDASFILNREISQHISVNLEYLFLNQDSDRREDEYRENRVSAGLVYQF